MLAAAHPLSSVTSDVVPWMAERNIGFLDRRYFPLTVVRVSIPLRRSARETLSGTLRDLGPAPARRKFGWFGERSSRNGFRIADSGVTSCALGEILAILDDSMILVTLFPVCFRGAMNTSHS